MEFRIFADPGSGCVNALNVGCQSGCAASKVFFPKHQNTFDPRVNLDNVVRRQRMDRELHRAHGKSEHRNGACEDQMTLICDDTIQKGTHVVEFSVQLCTQHWTAPRSKRHADAWAETDSPNGRHLKAGDRGGVEDHLMSHVFASQGQGASLVSCWQLVEGFVEPLLLVVSKHAAIGLPPASILYLLSREGTQNSVDGRSAVSRQVRHQGLDEILQPCHIDHFVPHYQEVVIVEVEAAFCGFSMAEDCCSQGQALARGSVQDDRIVGRMSFGLQWSVSWLKTHSVT